MTIVCTKCHKELHFREFRKDPKTLNGRRSICLHCDRAYARDYQHRTKQYARWNAENPEGKLRISKRFRLRERYGMTLEEYEDMLRRQQGRCAICGSSDWGMRRDVKQELVVEHDHYTGAVRGLLCMNCNAGIGNLKDDPVRIRAAQRDIMTEQRPYTMTGLARAIGLTRQSLLNYKERDEYFDSIQAAMQRCQEYAEGQLFGPYANGAKFNLINNYRGKYQPWADKQEITGANDAPLMPIGLDAAILARRTSKADGSTPPSTTADSDQPS
jgi:hypothetical protein